MNIFEKTAKKGDYFFYRRGNVITTKVWGRPSYDKLKKFFSHIKNETDILDHYKLYLIGGVLFSFDKTWDVDICMTGYVQNYEMLEKYMDLMYDLSLNQFNMLIDIQWLENPLPIVTYEDLLSPTFKKYNLTYIKTTHIIKQVGRDKSFFDVRNKENIETLTGFLVKGVHSDYPGKKNVLDKILNYPDKIIRSHMNVEEFLNNDEEYFLKNTNRNL